MLVDGHERLKSGRNKEHVLGCFAAMHFNACSVPVRCPGGHARPGVHRVRDCPFGEEPGSPMVDARGGMKVGHFSLECSMASECSVVKICECGESVRSSSSSSADTASTGVLQISCNGDTKRRTKTKGASLEALRLCWLCTDVPLKRGVVFFFFFDMISRR